MVRSHAVFTLAFVGATLAAVSVLAQSKTTGGQNQENTDASSDSPEVGSHPIHGFGLLRIPEVQNDLGMTEGQKVQILVLSMEMRETRFDMNKKLTEILNPKQLDRLKEIRLQVGGPAVLNSHEVVMALGLTWQQRSTLKDLQKQVGEQVKEIFQEVKGLTADERQAKKPEIIQRLEQMRQEMTEKGLNVLTPEQKAKFDRMQGKKLKFTSPPTES